MEGTILGSKLSLLRMKWEFRLPVLSGNSSVPEVSSKRSHGRSTRTLGFLHPTWRTCFLGSTLVVCGA